MKKQPLHWDRTILMGTRNENSIERWHSRASDITYNVLSKYGKPIDIRSLKVSVFENFANYISQYSAVRKKLFSGETIMVSFCPVCSHPVRTSASENIHIEFEVDGAKYTHCKNCDHYFLFERPTEKVLNEFYKTSETLSKYYTNKETLELRVEQVAIPKLDWVIEQFRKTYGRLPESILDVGAGGGHFVYACKKRGIRAVGIELNNSSIQFTKDNFDIDLNCVDFLKKNYAYVKEKFDIVTFWGVIEHTPYPNDFLRAAWEIMKGRETMVVVSVPRWNSFSTTVQKSFPMSVIRHLDPAGHIHCFSDTSIANAFEITRFKPCAAWYYGMDIYEMLAQFSHHLDDPDILNRFENCISSFQQCIDNGYLSDEIVLAGTPNE